MNEYSAYQSKMWIIKRKKNSHTRTEIRSGYMYRADNARTLLKADISTLSEKTTGLCKFFIVFLFLVSFAKVSIFISLRSENFILSIEHVNTDHCENSKLNEYL